MKKSGALWIVICAFAAGIIMLLIGGNMGESGASNALPEGHLHDMEDFGEYKSTLSESIRGVCQKLVGGGEFYVMLDFETSGEMIYAQNTNTNADGDKRSEYVIIGSGNNAEALYLGQRFPALSGIGVVCPSGVTQSQRDEICSLLAAAYGLPLTRVCVL